MLKIDEKVMSDIVKLLKKADFAINTLERANGNKMLFAETKTEIQKLVENLESRYLPKIST